MGPLSAGQTSRLWWFLAFWSEMSMANPLQAVHSKHRLCDAPAFYGPHQSGRLPIVDEMRRLVRLIER